MSYETLMQIGLGIGGGFFILSVVLFFVLKIPAVLSELTGRTARREIKAIQSRGRNGEGGSSNSKTTRKLRRGGFSFSRKGKTTEELLAQGREALKDRQAKGALSYTSDSLQETRDAEDTLPLKGSLISGRWGEGSTVPLNPNALSGSFGENPTEALNANQPTGDLRLGRSDGTEVPSEARRTASEAGNAPLEGASERKRDTQRLDRIDFDEIPKPESFYKKPEVNIEDRIIVVHTDELIGE